jgi:hypothetical protein
MSRSIASFFSASKMLQIGVWPSSLRILDVHAFDETVRERSQPAARRYSKDRRGNLPRMRLRPSRHETVIIDPGAVAQQRSQRRRLAQATARVFARFGTFAIPFPLW